MSGTGSATNVALLSPEAADEAVFRALDLFMGRGRRYSVEDVALGTRIPARTLYAFVAATPEERRRPKGCHLLLLAQFIGAEFTDRLLAPIGQGSRELHPEAGAPGMVVARLAAGAAEFAMRAADGRYCHRDLSELADDAAGMIQILTPFANGADT